MNKAYLLLTAAGLALAACGGQGDDTAGDKVASDAEATADQIEAQADAAADAGRDAAADQMDAQADAVREAGQNAEEAIDEADVKTNNPAATAAQVERQSGLPTSSDTAAEAAKGNQ